MWSDEKYNSRCHVGGAGWTPVGMMGFCAGCTSTIASKIVQIIAMNQRAGIDVRMLYMVRMTSLQIIYSETYLTDAMR
jgi:hypothetical protein